MTRKDLTIADQNLLDDIHARMERMDKRQSSFISNFLTSVAIGVTVFLILITGCFAYTDRIRVEGDQNSKDIAKEQRERERLMYEVGRIDGALKGRHPDSAVFGEAYDRIIKVRGADITPK